MKKMASFGGIKVWNEDALKFKGYSEFDVIYFYRPFINKEKQRKLEEKILSEMQHSAFLVAYLPILDNFTGFEKLNTNIWKKCEGETK